MKKWLVGFTCVLLANTAWGQNPATPPPGPMANPVQACPQPGCPQPLKTVCVPEPSTKIKVSINYSSVSEKVCLKGCSFPFFGKCQECDSGNCGNPYNKKYLVKKIVTQEEPYVKCVPVLVPACSESAIPYHGQPGVATPAQPGNVAPPVETIPVPPVPSKK